MSLTLEIKVMPQSGKQQLLRDTSGMIKCFLKNAPEGGKANEELIKLISGLLKIPQEQVKIMQGITSRKKVIRITTLQEASNVLMLLGLQTQLML